MPEPLEIAFFGSSLVSAYWNGAATYYRGMLRALAARGHRVTFYEPDAYDRQRQNKCQEMIQTRRQRADAQAHQREKRRRAAQIALAYGQRRRQGKHR